VKRPPHIVITLLVAAVAFGAILVVRWALTPKPPRAWLTDETAAFALARGEHKGVLIDFAADWSVPSVEMSATLDNLRSEIDRDFVRLRVDVSDQSAADEAMQRRYSATTNPAIVFVDASGKHLGQILHYAEEREIRDALFVANQLR
jgi:thiol:disulfide interchange protein